jgi:hypothetical protein
MLLAPLFVLRREYVFAFVALTAGILVKFVPLLLIPLLLAALVRDRRLQARQKITTIALAVTLSGALTVASYLPYGLRSIADSVIQLVHREDHFGNSLPAFVIYLLNDLFGVERGQALSFVSVLTKAAVVAFIAFRAWRLATAAPVDDREVTRSFARAGFETLFLFLMVAVLWIWPWYVSWIFAFAPFLSARGYAARSTVFSFSVFAIYVMIYFFGAYLLVTAHVGEVLRSALLVALAFVPPLVASAVTWLLPREPFPGVGHGRTRIAPAGM